TAFTPADPLAPKQWYLQDDHAFDAWAEPPTTLAPVKVAVVDSGVDCSLPDFQGRILTARSFVGGDPCSDTEGHGTFVAVLVAAVGNGDEAFSQPWPYASYPAALPHVIGVSALTRSGGVPDYSNRDPVFNDVAAPGSGVFSTFPLPLTAQRPQCLDQGYSD